MKKLEKEKGKKGSQSVITSSSQRKRMRIEVGNRHDQGGEEEFEKAKHLPLNKEGKTSKSDLNPGRQINEQYVKPRRKERADNHTTWGSKARRWGWGRSSKRYSTSRTKLKGILSDSAKPKKQKKKKKKKKKRKRKKKRKKKKKQPKLAPEKKKTTTKKNHKKEKKKKKSDTDNAAGKQGPHFSNLKKLEQQDEEQSE